VSLPVTRKEQAQKSPATLGDVLYAKAKAPVPEQDWATLVQSIAAGDQLALHALYERAHRIVFALVLRIAANRETAEELTIDVFHDVWRRASGYDAANGTVLGWTRRARARSTACASRAERSAATTAMCSRWPRRLPIPTT
jgi:RNA polymerase sigma-70 factor, ECF subfamily